MCQNWLSFGLDPLNLDKCACDNRIDDQGKCLSISGNSAIARRTCAWYKRYSKRTKCKILQSEHRRAESGREVYSTV